MAASNPKTSGLEVRSDSALLDPLLYTWMTREPHHVAVDISAVDEDESKKNSKDSESASPQQGDLRLSGPPSGQGAGSGARTRDRMVPADLRADSQATVLPTPPETTRRGMSIALLSLAY
ncbi:hypothetical protein PoB_004040900 [Plakobranchus ocellatus]|uniref:Uncharacterized protein n=1 Tax=Plakobranchus ocellatus TaxID=259542 RepID=A0AAV4B6B1_9GAST|nr:hypothetical protein PoB_004040900 [Plakobranchus ocellatus]